MRRCLFPLLALAIAVGAALAATELVLQDGRVLEGVDVRRQEDDYVLRLESGDTVVIPVELVKTVRLIETEPHKYPETRPYQYPEPEDLTEPPPDAPSGLVESDPQTLAGTPVRPPTSSSFWLMVRASIWCIRNWRMAL